MEEGVVEKGEPGGCGADFLEPIMRKGLPRKATFF